MWPIATRVDSAGEGHEGTGKDKPEGGSHYTKIRAIQGQGRRDVLEDWRAHQDRPPQGRGPTSCWGPNQSRWLPPGGEEEGYQPAPRANSLAGK